jgi:hypothetical protein
METIRRMSEIANPGHPQWYGRLVDPASLQVSDDSEAHIYEEGFMTANHGYLNHAGIFKGMLMTMVILAICTSLFSQSSRSSAARSSSDYEKVETELAWRAAWQRSNTGASLPVIIQFAADPAGPSELQNAPEMQFDREQAEMEHHRVVYAAGGAPKSHFTHLPAVAASVDRAALERLARHPLVTRISLGACGRSEPGLGGKNRQNRHYRERRHRRGD